MRIEYQNILADSSDRDTNQFSSVNSYDIQLTRMIKNVVSVELIGCSIANQASVTNYPYLILDLGSDLNKFVSVKNKYTRIFTNIYLKYNGTSPFLQPEFPVLQRSIATFKAPIDIDRISVNIRKPDGTLFPFGESSGDVSLTYANSFTFKIGTREPDYYPPPTSGRDN